MKLPFSILILACIALNMHAQTYKLNAQRYSYERYTRMPGDPHSPVLAGIASGLLPGLGQAVSGAPLRGLAFLGGTAAGAGVTLLGVYLMNTYNPDDRIYNPDTGRYESPNPFAPLAVLLAGAVGTVGVYVYSIIDATRVAKINNMYFQDKRKKERMSLQLNPYFDTNTYLGELKVSGGLSLTINF